MQTALHITTLVTEMRAAFVGGRIVSTEFYKKERAAYLFVKKDKKTFALAVVFHPVRHGYYLAPGSKITLTTREKPWPIFGLDGAQVVDVSQFGRDRLFRLDVDKNGERGAVICEAIGPNGNLWLLDASGNRLATLRKREFTEGEPYKPATAPPGDDPDEVTAETLGGMFKGYSSIVAALSKGLLGFNRTMAIEAVHRAGLDFVAPEGLDDNERKALATSVKELARRFDDPDTGYLYDVRGTLEVYPFKLSSVDDQPEKFKSLSLAVQAASQQRHQQVEQADEEKTIKGAVERAIKRMKRRLEKLDADIARAADFEQYRKLGELLQTNHTRLSRGMSSVTVTDVYDASGAEITIELDPALSPAENTDSYFRKYRKGREGLALLQRRREISQDEMSALQAMRNELDHNFAAAREKYDADLAALLPKESGQKEAAPRLPYREHQLDSGVTIFIGRDGSDNDRTTFEFARPWELWFHAQQCAGSHVVMKFPNKSFQPSKAELEQTAAIAAWHSKARHDTLVPVIYAERRYVRKPRKAKPGLVTVEREKSIMVTPKPAS